MGSKKKIAIISVSAILLVAMVGVVSYDFIRKSNTKEEVELSDSAKAIKNICEATDYKKTCESSLKSANSTDPKELMLVAFRAAALNINQAVKNASLIKKASMDPMTSQAMDICKDVLHSSVKGINSSMEFLRTSTMFESDHGDLKTWMGSAVTFRETCLDGFQNTTGPTGEKMKKLLKTAGELTSNALAMVITYSKINALLQGKGTPSTTTTHRRLLQYSTGGEYPPFVDDTSRNIISNNETITPNVIVALDGSGQFKTIGEAIKAVPEKNIVPFIIFVKEGIYEENILIPSSATRVVLIGEGPNKTTITGHKSYIDGTQTYLTATVAVEGDYFIAKNIGFENTAGPTKHQAVALRVTADSAVFFNCHINGYQDTLLAHNFRQFYRECTITGTIDFVFGDAQAIFQKCKFIVKKPLPNQFCMVTAQGKTDKNGPGALILQNCEILAAADFHEAGPTVKAYLGRPWKTFSKTIIMDTFIDSFIAPEGWSPWSGKFALDTLYYGEYQNTGPGANRDHRVKWKGIHNITMKMAERYTPGKYFGDSWWIREASVPFDAGLVTADSDSGLISA